MEKLLAELIQEIISWLPLLDRLKCILVCNKWSEIISRSNLYENLEINLDIDFLQLFKILTTLYPKIIHLNWRRNTRQ
jgi:hypothetical protein